MLACSPCNLPASGNLTFTYNGTPSGSFVLPFGAGVWSNSDANYSVIFRCNGGLDFLQVECINNAICGGGAGGFCISPPTPPTILHGLTLSSSTCSPLNLVYTPAVFYTCFMSITSFVITP